LDRVDPRHVDDVAAVDYVTQLKLIGSYSYASAYSAAQRASRFPPASFMRLRTGRKEFRHEHAFGPGPGHNPARRLLTWARARNGGIVRAQGMACRRHGSRKLANWIARYRRRPSRPGGDRN